MLNIKKIFVFFVAIASFVSVSANAQNREYSVDGLWLKKGAEAFLRIEDGTTKNIAKDSEQSSSFMHYIGGFLAVHRKNNVMTTVLVSGISDGRPFDKLSKSQQEQVRIAFAFAPLFALPDNLSMPQLVAILLGYIGKHPEEWNLPAVVILQSALVEAFPRLR